MLIYEFDRVCRAKPDTAGTDPDSGGKQEGIESGESPADQSDAAASPDENEKLFTEPQVNNIVRTRLEKERRKTDKEVESRLREIGFDGPEDAKASLNWRREKKEFLERAERDRERLEQELADSGSRFDEELRRYEAENRSWRDKYESLLKREELTQAALKAGADPANIDMIVTFTEGSLRPADGGGFQVVEKDGALMLDPETGAGVTVERFMRNFLSERPGLVRASPVRGAGTGALGTKTGRYTLDEIREIARTDPKKYAELKNEGVVQAIYDRHLSGR